MIDEPLLFLCEQAQRALVHDCVLAADAEKARGGDWTLVFNQALRRLIELLESGIPI